MLKRLAILSLLFTIGILLMEDYAFARNNKLFAFSIDDTDVKITMPACRTFTGSVTGLKIINPDGKQFTYSWTSANGSQVATTLDLTFKSDGRYTLKVTATDGSEAQTYGPVILISTAGVTIDTLSVQITPSICEQATGDIRGVKASGPGTLIYSWTNSNGVEVGTHADISGLSTGSYMLGVRTQDGFCGVKYGPVIIPNAGGPVIDESAVEVLNTDCQNFNGQVTGIKVTGSGTLRYEWSNVNNDIVSTELNLIKMKVGLYRLKVFDDGGCGPSYSKPYTIDATLGNYRLYQNNLKITPTTCDELGSVTGLRANSLVMWRWTDEQGNIVSETNELRNATGGRYLLVVTTNCKDPNSGLRTVIRFNLGPKRVILPDFPVAVKGTCVGSNTGSIKVTGNDQVAAYNWFDAYNQPAGTGNEIKNLAGGSYSLYLVDTMGCNKLYKTYIVPASTGAQILTTFVNITNDECHTSIGSITGVQATGGIAPYTYKWLNAGGSIAGENADLLIMQAATYTLQVFDASGCNPAIQNFTIGNNDSFETPQLPEGFKLCYPMPVSFSVKNPKPNSFYRLYDSNTTTTPIDEQATGSFTITPTQTTTYYITRVGGTCESEKAAIKVSVALNSLKIANTFSPNNDGINDTWNLQGLENNSAVNIKVFNRTGTQVFESKGYAKPFNGTYNGSALPAGTYYYLIDFNGECKTVSGSITLIN